MIDPLQRRCPYCASGPGEPCETSSGKKISDVHRDRCNAPGSELPRTVLASIVGRAAGRHALFIAACDDAADVIAGAFLGIDLDRILKLARDANCTSSMALQYIVERCTTLIEIERGSSTEDDS